MKRIIKHIVFIILFLTSFSLKGQIQADTIMKKIEQLGYFLLYRNHDTSYIKSYADQFSLKLVAVNKYNFFTMIDREKKNTLRYRPELGVNLGIGIAYKWFAFDLVFNTGLYENENFTNQDFFDFQGKMFSSKQYIEGTFQYYYGYKVDNNEVHDNSKVRSDIRTIKMGLQYLHAFNYDKFSIKAPFVLNDIQRKSAGSIIGGIGFTMNIMDGDSSVIPLELANDFNPKLHMKDLNTTSLTANIGYMYTFVLKESFFLTLSFIPGGNITVGDYWTDDRYRINTGISFNIKSMNAIGYNGKRVFAGLQLVSDDLFIRIDKKLYTETAHGKLSFFIGYRFKKKDKKRK